MSGSVYEKITNEAMNDSDKEESKMSEEHRSGTNQTSVSQTNLLGLNMPVSGIKLPMIRKTTSSAKPIDAWLSCRLELESFDLENECFTISGYVNVFWKWDEFNDPKMAHILMYKPLTDVDNEQNEVDIFLKRLEVDSSTYDIFKEKIPDYSSLMETKSILDNDCLDKMGINTFKDRIKLLRAMKNMPIHLSCSDEDESTIDINDVREFEWKHKLPLDPDRPFHLSTIVELEHLQPPYLRYDRVSGDCHSRYHIKVTLFEQLELFAFPFDFQFLNIKFWWKWKRFRLIHDDIRDDITKPYIYELDSHSNGDNDFIKQIEREIASKNDKRRKFFKRLLTIGCKRADITLLKPWMYFNHCDEKQTNFAWIRLRIKRAPIYHVMTSLFPIVLIVFCSFGTFWFDDEGDSLNYAITVLLTFVAQQTFIEYLPRRSEMLFAHYYDMMGYVVQAAIIAWAIGHNYDVVAFVILSIWILTTLLYLGLWLKWCCIADGKRHKSDEIARNDLGSRNSYLCCLRYKDALCLTWRQREKRERYDWMNWQDREAEESI